MAVKLQRVNPLNVRDDAIEFFWRMRAWPFGSREEYARCWDWRYTAIPEIDPTIWIALDGTRIVGHVACNIRSLRCMAGSVRAGVPGNYLVDPGYRNTILGPQLASAPMKLAQRGEIDIFLGYSNQIAHSLALGLGCRDLGRMHPFVDVRRWGPALGRRLGGAQLLGPIVNTGAAIARAVLGRPRARPPAGFVAKPLTQAELVSLDRSHWKAPRYLSWDGSSGYLARRFLLCPVRSYQAFAIIDARTSDVQGVVICEGIKRLSVIQSLTNSAVLTDAEAVELTARAMPAAEVVVVPMLPDSALAESFEAAGFIQRSLGGADAVLENTAWSATWRAAHPLAAEFAESRAWKLWYGWNSH